MTSWIDIITVDEERTGREEDVLLRR